jgi:hypothetical protein
MFGLSSNLGAAMHGVRRLRQALEGFRQLKARVLMLLMGV